MRTVGRASTRSRELRLVFPLILHEMACTSLGDLTYENERPSRLSALRPIQSANREEDVGPGIPIPLQLRVAQLHAVRSPLNGMPNGSTIASIVKRKAQTDIQAVAGMQAALIKPAKFVVS
jgi:hypothetical protein